MRTELDGPGAAQEEVEEDGDVVDLRGVEVTVLAQAVGVLVRCVAFAGGQGEEVEVPVFGDVPVEAEEGVEEDEEEPEAEEGGFGEVDFRRVVAALDCRKDDDGECGGVFQCVG